MCHIESLVAFQVDNIPPWFWLHFMKKLKASHWICCWIREHIDASHEGSYDITWWGSWHHIKRLLASDYNTMANHTCVTSRCWWVYQLMMFHCGLKCVTWRCLKHHMNTLLSQGRHRCILWKHWLHHMTLKLASHASGNVVTQQDCWHLAIRRWHTIIPSSGEADGFTFWWCSIVVLNASHEVA
jgi:hypothetical protein